MNREPRFAYYLDRESTRVRPGEPLWDAPLPMHRRPRSQEASLPPIRYADYFEAVHSFIAEGDFRVLRSALANVEKNPSAFLRNAEHIGIFLAKHGAFYHPGKVVVSNPKRTHGFVVNAAFSAAGRETIAGEYRILNDLAGRFIAPTLPRVYGFSPAAGRMRVPVFIGEWLDGFLEFHVTADSPRGQRRIVVWNPERGNAYLSPAQTRQLFQCTARILTQAYDLETSSHIAGWHHAAGDFVVRPRGESAVDVRLITVRGYTPMMRDMEHDLRAALDALVVFFVRLTLKNRLDRRDGVGDVALAPVETVAATIDGFFRGLGDGVGSGRLPAGFPELIRGHLGATAPGEVADLVYALIDRFPAETGERKALRDHAAEHADRLYAHLSKTG